MHGTKDEYCTYMPQRASLRSRVSFLVSSRIMPETRVSTLPSLRALVVFIGWR